MIEQDDDYYGQDSEPVTTPDEHEREQDGRDTGRDSQGQLSERVKWTDKVVAVFSVLMFLATTAYVIVSSWQLKATRDAIELTREELAATQRAAEAAKQSAEAAMASQRPWIIVKTYAQAPRLEETDAGVRVVWTIEYTNEGGGTAIGIESEYEYSITPTIPERVLDYRGYMPRSPYAPSTGGLVQGILKSGESSGRGGYSKMIPWERFESFQPGWVQLNGQLILFYRDRFGGGFHSSSVCVSFAMWLREPLEAHPHIRPVMGGSHNLCAGLDANDVK